MRKNAGYFLSFRLLVPGFWTVATEAEEKGVRSMKKLPYRVVLIIFVMLMVANEASAFRCGNRLVATGDSKYDVLWKCGDPAWVESWVENRVEPYSIQPFPDGRRLYLQNPTFAVVSFVAVEQWTYDFGPNQFIRVLFFENNRLMRIETGGYGH